MKRNKKPNDSGAAKSGEEEQTIATQDQLPVRNDVFPQSHFEQSRRNSTYYQDYGRDIEYIGDFQSAFNSSSCTQMQHQNHPSHNMQNETTIPPVHPANPPNSDANEMPTHMVPGSYPYPVPNYYPVYYYCYPPPGYPVPSYPPAPHQQYHLYPHMYPLPLPQDHLDPEKSSTYHAHHQFDVSEMTYSPQRSQHPPFFPPPPRQPPLGAEKTTSFSSSHHPSYDGSHGAYYPPFFSPQGIVSTNQPLRTQEQQTNRATVVGNQATSTSRQGDYEPKRNDTEEDQEEEQRRMKRNLMLRKKERELRERMNLISKKKDENKTEDEINAYILFEKRRHRKNQRSRERTKENREEMERILGIPESSRTEEEKKWLHVTLKAKRKKNENDRLRRKRIKMGQSSSISSSSTLDRSNNESVQFPVPSSINMSHSAHSHNDALPDDTHTTNTTTRDIDEEQTREIHRQNENESSTRPRWNWSSSQTTSHRSNPLIIKREQQCPEVRETAPSNNDNDDYNRNIIAENTANDRPHTPSNILDELVEYMAGCSPTNSISRVFESSPSSISRNQQPVSSKSRSDHSRISIKKPSSADENQER